MRELNLAEEIDRITDFIKTRLTDSGFRKVIVGLSGGIDSSVTAALAVKAAGRENVTGLMMPSNTSDPESLNDAITIAEQLGIHFRIVEISPMVDLYFKRFEPEAGQLRRGNRMARERMCILYDLSAKYNALVAGTGNRSELLVGYCTQYGDSACAFEPIGHLYKTEIKALAALLNIPDKIINKNPSADLWQDQTDEEELGISYPMLDEILHRIFDLGRKREDLIVSGYQAEDVDRILELHRKSEFKRRMPPVPEIGQGQ